MDAEKRLEDHIEQFINTGNLLRWDFSGTPLKKSIQEFLDFGRKCWTLSSGRWTLGTELWTLDATFWTLGSGHWTLFQNTVFHCFRTLGTVSLDHFRIELESSLWFHLIKLLKILWVQISKDLMVMLAL